MEQGLGKSKIILDTAEILFNERKINALLIVAPNGVHVNWVKHEIPYHLDVPYFVLEYQSREQYHKHFQEQVAKFFNDRERRLNVLVINTEAFSTPTKAVELSRACLAHYRTLMVIDESSRIKTPSAARTKRLIALGRHAVYRRILTGTPVTQSPFDFYSQFYFLDPRILGFNSYYAFKHRYGVFEKKMSFHQDRNWTYENLVRYVNLTELTAKIEPFSFRRTKEECLDLPAKIYKVIYVDLSPLQQRLIKEVSELGILEFESFEEFTPLQITRLLRAQQILGGFLPTGELPENPRLEKLLEVIDDHPGKTIVWCRFKAEINAVSARLRQAYGTAAVVEFHGAISSEQKTENAIQFQKNPAVRFLVGQQRSGIGVDLFAAETVIYYSNTFSYEERYQSEDRCHRIGLNHPVVYIDLVARNSVDEKIQRVLSRSARMATKLLDEKRMKGGETGAC